MTELTPPLKKYILEEINKIQEEYKIETQQEETKQKVLANC